MTKFGRSANEGGGGQPFIGRNSQKKTSDVPKQFSEKSRRLSLMGSEILDLGSHYSPAKFQPILDSFIPQLS